MNEELKSALEALETKVKTSTVEETKTAIEAVKESIETEIKAKTEALETKAKEEREAINAEIKELKDLNEVQQKHLDSLDVKMQGGKGGNIEQKSAIDLVAEGIRENFDSIKEVKSGKSFNMEVKAVGDMTLGASLTGDAYRSYSNTVAANPAHKVNFADLVGVIPIGQGTYTFPREGTVEGSISTQTEGAAKSQIDSALTHVDVATDFLAGFARYSKKMANNVTYLEGFLPRMLRREYLKAESASFYATLIAAATASAQIITGKNKIEMLMNEFATLEGLDHDVTAVVVTPADYWSILQIEKSTGAGYGLPGVVTLDNGQLRVNGVSIVRANWVAANKYIVGDWTTVSKVVTEGLSLQFSTEDTDNFTKNNITARIEAQIGLAIHRPDAVIYGDFTAI